MSSKMSDFKKKLEEMFSTEEAIGIRSLHYGSGETEEEFLANGNDIDDFCSETCLPDGTNMFICTNCADFVIKKLGEGCRYGFYVEENPTVTDDEILSVGGHDFAVIRGRFIVDLWTKHYAEITEKAIFDLWDKRDYDQIRALYGDPSNWACSDILVEKYYEAANTPADKKILIGKPGQNFDYSMC